VVFDIVFVELDVGGLDDELATLRHALVAAGFSLDVTA
jgi:hypothetical protein